MLHRTERPSRGRFHAGRGHAYASDLVERHISEIGLCSGHSASMRVQECGFIRDGVLFLSDRVLVASKRPGRIRATLDVDLPRPRNTLVLTAPEFIQLERRALELLHSS